MVQQTGYSWSRVSYNGITGYVITGALTYDAPVEEPDSQVEEPEEPEENPEDDNPEEPIDENVEALKQITEELGSLPEVGINVMPYIFLGSVIACLVMCYEIKFRKINR